MAESRTVDPFGIDYSDKIRVSRRYRRLSLLNGLFIGLALGLGAWAVEAVRIARLPVTNYLPTLLLGLGVALLIGVLAGWLSGRIARTPITIVIWLLAGVAFMWTLSYLPYYGRSLVVWLTNWRFWGRTVFPFILEATPGSLVLAGFFILLTLAGLALVQNYRLENLTAEINHRGRMSTRGWVALLWPLPIVFLVSLITHNTMANPAAPAAEVIYRAIPVARDYEGDLRELELGDGIDYGALRSVHDRLDGDFTLSIVDINPLTSTVVVGADFAGGAWVYCRVINGQLSFCYDASPPYTIGLRSLITGEPLPDPCRGCALMADDVTAAWLAERRDRFGPAPAIERVAQQGSHVLMRVVGDGGFTAECWIEGIGPTRLTSCEEVGQ